MRLNRIFFVQLPIFALLLNFVTCLFDPISLAVIGAGAWLVNSNYKQIKEHTFCRFKECCIDSYIPTKING